MYKCLVTVLCTLVLPLIIRAEDPPKMEQVERLVREFAFSEKPYLNPKTEFHILNLQVKGLWETLKLQVYDIEYQTPGQPFDGFRGYNGFVGLYHERKIYSLSPALGGWGLMSGVVHSGEFYYTYSWGSGIHRSHIAKLQIVDGILKKWSSKGFEAEDLFVSSSPDDKIHVLSGKFKDFNHCEAGKYLGTVKAIGSSEIEVVDARGNAVKPSKK